MEHMYSVVSEESNSIYLGIFWGLLGDYLSQSVPCSDREGSSGVVTSLFVGQSQRSVCHLLSQFSPR